MTFHAKERRAVSARAGMRSSSDLVATDDTQLRPVRLSLQDRRLPLARQVLESVGVEHRLVELAALFGAHFAERRVGDDLPDAAAQRGARQLDVGRQGVTAAPRRVARVAAPTRRRA
jgi:hypothetical protein